MNKFVIVGGLPYLFANGKTYAVRWDEQGFTVGMEVEMASIPSSPVTYSELSILAKCAGRLNSIDVPKPDPDGQGEPEQPEKNQEPDKDDQGEPEQPEENLDKEDMPDIESMTVAQLKETADRLGIDLGNSKKKAEILAVLKGREGE